MIMADLLVAIAWLFVAQKDSSVDSWILVADVTGGDFSNVEVVHVF